MAVATAARTLPPMVAIPESARALLDGPHLAHVVTLDPDGGPQVSCVWVGLDGDEVVFGSLGPWRKLRNLERDPRVGLSIEATEVNDIGMREYLVLHGTARIEPGGAPELLQELAHVYVGPGRPVPADGRPAPGLDRAHHRRPASAASAPGPTEPRRRLGRGDDVEDPVDEVVDAGVELVPPDRDAAEHLGAPGRHGVGQLLERLAGVERVGEEARPPACRPGPASWRSGRPARAAGRRRTARRPSRPRPRGRRRDSAW